MTIRLSLELGGGRDTNFSGNYSEKIECKNLNSNSSEQDLKEYVSAEVNRKFPKKLWEKRVWTWEIISI